jgi:uncharacterized protein (DUF2252 family)
LKSFDPSDRSRKLAGLRNVKMARSPHAYVRGSTTKFYEWLNSSHATALPEGPAIWICGDCHVGNLGPVANTFGRVEIQLRDFDQAVIGNPAHDLIRLALSLASAARGSNLPGVTTARMIEKVIEGYVHAFDPENDAAMAKLKRPKPVRDALKRALGRSFRHLAEERTGGAAAKIPIGKRFWAVSDEERKAVEAMLTTSEMGRLATALRERPNDARIEVLDCAYWVKGCSSLGSSRYAVLLDVDQCATRGDKLCLIDIKEASRAAAPRTRGARMPRGNGERVVTAARHLSPFLGDRMQAGRLLDKSVFVRELLPQDLKLEIDRIGQGEAQTAAFFLASVVGAAHARQMDGETRQAWQKELARNATKTLDAPSWLWTSVVELLALHESAYLDHCRRYSLECA